MTSELARCIAKIVGARLRELRVDAEMTQEQIADATGIHRPVVARMERGIHVADVDTVTRYANALGLGLADVLVCLDEAWIEAGQQAKAWAEQVRA